MSFLGLFDVFCVSKISHASLDMFFSAPLQLFQWVPAARMKMSIMLYLIYI